MLDPSADFQECHDCGLQQRVPETPNGALAVCERCRARLQQTRSQSILLCGACAAVGLMLLGLGFLLPVASVSMSGGRGAQSDLLTGPVLLRQTGAWELSLATVATLILLPFLKLAVVLAMSVAVTLRRVPRSLKRAFALLPQLSEWAMVEVFLLGSTIALVRLRDWMDVRFGPALLALGGVALCSLGIDAALDKRAFWSRVSWSAAASTSEAGTDIGCIHCGLVTHADPGTRCPRCHSPLHPRKHGSAKRTWALIIAAAFTAIPANVLPVMTVQKLGRGGPKTILGGTVELAQEGFFGLATLVFVASIIVPVAKLVALAALLVMTARSSDRRLLLRTRVYRVVATIGRWSMIDIFATATLVALARFGWLGSVYAERGAIAFCCVVVLTLLASEAFDPRLMWDAAGHNSTSSLPAGAVSEAR